MSPKKFIDKHTIVNMIPITGVSCRHGRDRMVVGFITSFAVSAHLGGVLDTALCDTVCQ